MRKLFSGPPPSVGWWPASRTESPNELRWWNGSHWSIIFRRANDGMTDFRDADNPHARAPELPTPIQWQHRPASWPERSRT